MNVPAVLSAAASGDSESWNRVVERFNPLVWATVRAHRLSNADAADAVQTTWLRLVEHLDRIENPDRLGSWLATTARRESLRVIAARARVVATDDFEELASVDPGPAQQTLTRDRDELLRRALGRLGDRCRMLLRLLAADPPPSYSEISAALDVPVGSIGPTRGRCLERLRVELQQVGISDGL